MPYEFDDIDLKMSAASTDHPSVGATVQPTTSDCDACTCSNTIGDC